MHLNERQKKIRNILIDKGRMSTAELSELLNVSEQTIRKDLNLLEKENVIKRVHGGAEVITTFMDRLNLYSDNKDRLCRVAAQYINDGDYVFIDGGTTYYYLIDYIPSDISVTIVTSSIPIAEKIKRTSEQEVYILGGVVQSTTLETYSPNMINEVSNMIFDKAYFGVTGFSRDVGQSEVVRRKALKTGLSQKILM